MCRKVTNISFTGSSRHCTFLTLSETIADSDVTLTRCIEIVGLESKSVNAPPNTHRCLIYLSEKCDNLTIKYMNFPAEYISEGFSAFIQWFTCRSVEPHFSWKTWSENQYILFLAHYPLQFETIYMIVLSGFVPQDSWLVWVFDQTWEARSYLYEINSDSSRKKWNMY